MLRSDTAFSRENAVLRSDTAFSRENAVLRSDTAFSHETAVLRSDTAFVARKCSAEVRHCVFARKCCAEVQHGVFAQHSICTDNTIFVARKCCEPTLGGAFETFEHIFLNCYHTQEFVKKTAQFIVRYLDSSYKDSKGYHRLTLSHSNPHINLVNSVANWYIGKKFQNKNHLDFLEYTRELNHFLLGEKAPLANTLKNILHH